MEQSKINNKLKHDLLSSKILVRFFIAGFVASVGVISTGCVTYGIGVGLGSHGHSRVGISTTIRPKRKTRSQRADTRTKTEVLRILSGYRLNTRQIRVKVRRGLVTLRGPVQSRGLEQDIISRIARLPGVHTVRSRMYVRYARK